MKPEELKFEFLYLDSSFLRMRRSSMKLRAVIVQSTDPNMIITIVSIARGAPSPLTPAGALNLDESGTFCFAP